MFASLNEKEDRVKTIEVTQDDIDGGMAYDAAHCPVAIALRRQLDCRNAHAAADFCNVFYLKDPNSRELYSYQCDLPEEAKRFIEDYDKNRPVQPFVFEVDVPGEGEYFTTLSEVYL